MAISKETAMEILAAGNAVGKTDEIKAGIALYKNCCVLVDKAFEDRDIFEARSNHGNHRTLLRRT